MTELDLHTRAWMELGKTAVRLRRVADQILDELDAPSVTMIGVLESVGDVYERWSKRLDDFLTDAIS